MNLRKHRQRESWVSIIRQEGSTHYWPLKVNTLKHASRGGPDSAAKPPIFIFSLLEAFDFAFEFAFQNYMSYFSHCCDKKWFKGSGETPSAL